MNASHSTWLRTAVGVVAATLACFGSTGRAEELQLKWVTSWTAPMQAALVAPAYDLQPGLLFALPNATARNQTFRMIVKPDIWGQLLRVRLSNAFGTQPVTFSAVSIALQKHDANILPGSSQTVTFGGSRQVVVRPGDSVFSDPIALKSAAPVSSLFGLRKSSGKAVRNLAVSFAVSGSSDSLSFHRDAAATSYISPPNSGDATVVEDDKGFPFSTTSSFFLSELDVAAAAETVVVEGFGSTPSPTALSAR